MNLNTMFFLPQLGGGGAEMNAARVGAALASMSHEISFAVCRGPGTYAQSLSDKVAVEVLKTGRINSSTLRLIRSAGPLREYISRRRPDILCPVMDRWSLAALAAVRKLKNRPKVVLSIQNSLKAKYVDRPTLQSRTELALIRRFYPRADHVIALSNGVADELQELVPALEGRISVVHNAGAEDVEQDRVTPPAIERPASGQLIVACGRLVEQKGYPYLLRAFSRLVLDRDLHLWILGEGPLQQKLSAMAESLGITSRVRFMGFRDEPQAYMRAADVFVLSSLWEGFGNVIVEAMATGTPVVATDCPHGPGEIIQDGVSGLLVPPGNEQALARALERSLADDDLRQQLSAAALRRAEDFSPGNIARQYADVFTRVLSE